jgi:acyl-coenzyme A synthetase/AMP-(fatty) acid ligase
MITLTTSGSTGNHKIIHKNENEIMQSSCFLHEHTKLNENDIILNAFPTATIAYWSFVFYHSKVSGSKIYNIFFNPKTFWNLVFQIKPTFIPLAINTLRTLLKLNDQYLDWKPQFLTGSDIVEENDIENILKIGGEVVWNVYGSTEFSPPVFISKNSTKFDFNNHNKNFNIKFKDNGLLYINDINTNDIFDLKETKFLKREIINENKTWKSI